MVGKLVLLSVEYIGFAGCEVADSEGEGQLLAVGSISTVGRLASMVKR